MLLKLIPNNLNYSNINYRNKLLFLIALNFTLLLIVLIITLFTDVDAYWTDELFTVTSSLLPVKEAFSIAFHDNHPPLYPVFMWFWVKLFSDAEFWTRISSLIFAVSSVLVLFKLRPKFDDKTILLTAIFLSANSYWLYYAFEARGYMPAMFFATLSLVYAITNKPYKLLLSGIALGLLHFYGTLLASLHFAFLFLINLRNLKDSKTQKLLVSIFLAQILITLYPIYHVTINFGKDIIGGHFWVDTSPQDAIVLGISATLNTFFSSVRGILHEVNPFGYYLTGSLLVAFCLAIVLFFKANHETIKNHIRANSGSEETIILKLLAILVIVFITVIALLSLHTPLGLHRHFIVLVPTGSLLMAILISPIFHDSTNSKTKFYSYLFIAATVMFSQLSTIELFKYKWIDNTKRGAYIKKLVEIKGDKPLYHLNFAPTSIAKAYEESFNYYAPKNVRIKSIRPEELSELPIGSIVAVNFTACTDGKFDDEIIKYILTLIDIKMTWYYNSECSRKWGGYLVIEEIHSSEPTIYLMPSIHKIN